MNPTDPGVLLPQTFLLDVAWQSTLVLACGLLLARVLTRTPSRAHMVLLLAMTAAIAAPLLSTGLRLGGWGLWAPAAPALGAELPAMIPPAATPRADTSTFDLLTIVFVTASVAWSLASMLAIFRLVISTIRGWRMLRAAHPIGGRTARLARDVARRLALSCVPDTRLSDQVTCPVIWCWGRRPCVLLPRALTRPETRDLTGLLCHELAHWKRRDHLAALATELAVCLLPWHPLAWLARARLRELSEQACDTWAIASGEPAVAYADALLGFAARRQPALALAAVSSRRGLDRRIRRILEFGDVEDGLDPNGGGRWLLAAALTTLLVVGTVAAAHRRAPSPQPASPGIAAVPMVADAVPIGVTGAPQPSTAAGVVIVPGELDLGAGPPGLAQPGVAWIVNIGSDPVNLLRVKASCGCTTVTGFRAGPLEPGAAIQIDITMTAPEAGAHKTKSVTFFVEGQTPLGLPVHLDGVVD